MNDQRQPTQLRRAVLSSFLGSVIEYYDFLLYATASAVVFSKVFFADVEPWVGILLSYGTLLTGYIARPLGGIIFGHYGDRIGRKRMLILSMVGMGVASTLIGLLPGHAQIGVIAPLLLILLRVLQGIAVGGEWAGAVLMSAEHATSRRGLWASFTISGAPMGMVVSTLVLALASAISGSEEAFLSWGWRIPFLLSVVLLGIGLFVRLRVEETPVFNSAEEGPRRPPVMEVLTRYPREMLLAIGTGFGAFVMQGTLTVFLISYATTSAGLARQDVLNALTVSSLVAAVTVLAASSLTDRLGRRPVVITAAILLAIYAFAMFPMVDTGSVAMFYLAVILGQGIIHASMFGPMAAIFAEIFPTKVRYTGSSMGYQIGGIGAGLSPVVFASVLAGGGGTVTIAIILAVCIVVSIGSLWALGETSNRELTEADGGTPVSA